MDRGERLIPPYSPGRSRRRGRAISRAARRYSATSSVEMMANNLTNLFEMPGLFLAIVPMPMLAGRAGLIPVVLAWAFAVRCAAHNYVHGYVHGARCMVPCRSTSHLASTAVLSAMWIVFFIDMVGAGASDTRVVAATGVF